MSSIQPTAIITGINGQDGKLLRIRLEIKGYKVIGTSRNPNFSNCIKLSGSNCEKDISSLVEVLKQRSPELLFHLASENRPSVDVAGYGERELYVSNVLLTELILESVLAYSPSTHVVLVGSSQQFAFDSTMVVASDSPQKPKNYYAWTKSYNQGQAAIYREKGLSITYAILFNHDSWARKSGFLIPSMARELLCVGSSLRSASLESKVVLNIQEPRAAFDLSSAHDTVDILLKLAESRHSIDTTIGSQSTCSIPYLARCMEEITGLNILVNGKIPPVALLANADWRPHPLASNEYRKVITDRPKRSVHHICREILGYVAHCASRMLVVLLLVFSV